jgi:hypothetical protein
VSSVIQISACLNAIAAQSHDRWSWAYFEEKHYWRIKYSGTVPPCEIYMEMNGPSLCMQVDMGHLRVRPECQAALNLFLLCLNEELPVLKFGMRKRGKITLMAEALAGQINLGTLEDLLQALVAVFAQYRREIELLAGEPALAELVMKSSNAAAASAVRILLVKPERATQSKES